MVLITTLSIFAIITVFFVGLYGFWKDIFNFILGISIFSIFILGIINGILNII